MVRSLSHMRFFLRAISIKAISSCSPQLLKSVAESTGIYLFLPVCISENRDVEPSWCFWNVPAALTCRLTWIHPWMFPVTSPWRRMLVHRWLSMLFSAPIGVRTVRTKVYLRSKSWQENFTAQQLASLLRCNLPGNSSHSRMIWKMLLTNSNMVLDPALDILANMVSSITALWKAQMSFLHNDTFTWFHQQSMSIVVPSATVVLDVIREIRFNLLTEEQLRNQSVITRWFSKRLSRLLPYASAQFLTCLSHRNLSCHSYQQM